MRKADEIGRRGVSGGEAWQVQRGESVGFGVVICAVERRVLFAVHGRDIVKLVYASLGPFCVKRNWPTGVRLSPRTT